MNDTVVPDGKTVSPVGIKAGAPAGKTEAPFRVGAAKWLLFTATRSRAVAVGAFVFGLLAVGMGIWGLAMDLRWLVVALMLLFLVMPTAVAMLFFSYGLKEVNSLNLSWHTLRKEGGDFYEITLMARDPETGDWQPRRSVRVEAKPNGRKITDKGGDWVETGNGGQGEWLFVPGNDSAGK